MKNCQAKYPGKYEDSIGIKSYISNNFSSHLRTYDEDGEPDVAITSFSGDQFAPLRGSPPNRSMYQYTPGEKKINTDSVIREHKAAACCKQDCIIF